MDNTAKNYFQCDCHKWTFSFRRLDVFTYISVIASQSRWERDSYLYKLILLCLPDYLLFFPKSYLEGCIFTLHLNDYFHPHYHSGLPQGAVLSTTLLPLYLSDMLRSPHTHLTLYMDNAALLSQSWHPDTIFRRLSQAVTNLLKYFTKWKLRLNTDRTETIPFSKHCPSVLGLLFTFVPWTSAVQYLGCLLDSKLLYTEHLHTIANRATAVLCNIFTLLAQDSLLTKPMKLTLYKLLIWSILTYATPVYSSTCPFNYLKLQVIQNKHLWVIGNYPTCITLLALNPSQSSSTDSQQSFLLTALPTPHSWSKKSGITP